MEIDYNQIGILLFQSILISALILLLFRIRSIMGLSLLYTALGLFQYMQTFLASTVYIEVAKGLIVSPGSSVLFAGSLFAVLIVYIKEDAGETRKVIYALLIANVIMSLLLFLFGWQFHKSTIYNPLNVSHKFFDYNAWILFVGTVTLFIDAVLIIILYEFISKYIPILLLRIYLTMFLVLSFDTICFSLIAFSGFENLGSIIKSGLIAKNSSVLIYGFIFYIYLKYFEKEGVPNKTSFKDIFYSLSYRQKYEIIQKEKEIELQKAEKKIKLSAIKYETLANNSPVGIFLTRPDGYTIYVNPKWSSISGISKDAALGYGWLTAVHPEDKEKIANSWALATNKKVTSYAEYRFIHPSGEIKWVLGQAVPEIDADGQIIGYVGTITDITEIKNYEQQLKKAKEQTEESEAFLESIVENIPNMIFIKDAKDLRFVRFNKAGEDLLGYKSSELIGKNDYDLFPEKQAEFFTSTDRRILEKEGIESIEEEKIDTKNGTRILYTKKVAIKDKNGNNKYLLGISEDITQKKEIIKELIAAKEKAEESDRLKSAFLANISHEIRTPMNGILGFAELLKEPDLTGEQKNEYIDLINKSGQRMLNIINNIVDISKIESGLVQRQISQTNINEQIEYICNFFKPDADKKGVKITCNKTLPTNEAFIKTDSEKLYAIFFNLVKNAIKYTDSGTVEIGYFLRKSNELSSIEFYIADTGIGIPKDRQSAIFERFIQADIADREARQGAGLGLSIAKAYVELLGGDIRVESQEGKGSTFYFTLPFTSAPESVSQSEHITDFERQIRRKLKILIAEDDENTKHYLSILLADISFELLYAQDGVEAVELCRKNPDIDLILMDILMPRMNGHEATRQIRLFNNQVIIIAQTAYALSGDHEKALNAGCNGYICKPISKTKLLSTIAEHLK